MTRMNQLNALGAMVANLSFLLIAAALCACTTTIPKLPVNEFKTPVVVEAPLNTVLSVAAGERMFVRGALFEIDALAIDRDIESTIPNSMSTTLKFSIKKCDLLLNYQTKTHLYFCAPRGNVEVSHPRLGLVLSPDDYVGIRKSKHNNKLEWFIDNSGFYSSKGFDGTWIWSRELKEKEVDLKQSKARILEKTGEWVALYYAGFFDGKVHFELEDSSDLSGKRREFQFNVDPSGKETKAAIKGFQFEIIAVDNLALKYRWIAVD
jgi:hypothetical protein